MQHVNSTKNTNTLNPKTMTMLLFVAFNISLSLFLIGTYSKTAVVVNYTDFLGLLPYLSAYYWIGLFILICKLITIYFYDVCHAKLLSVCSVILLGIYLLSPTVFIQENGSFFVSYYPAGEIKSILQSHYLDVNREGQLIAYYSWPGMHFFSAINMLTLDVGLESLIKYIPMLWVIVFILLTYPLARKIGLDIRQWLLMAWLLITAQWVGQYYYSAQALAIIIYLIILTFILDINVSKFNSVILILAICTLVITHSLTPFAVFIGTCIMSINKVPTRYLAILYSVLFLAFYMYLSHNVFVYGVHEFIGKIINMENNEFWKSSEFRSEITSLSRKICHYAKGFFALSFGVFLIAALWALIKNRQTWPSEKRKIFFDALLFLTGIGMLLLFRYGTEMQYRVYLYSSVIIAGLFILSYPRSKLIVIFTVMLTIVHFPAHYGTYSYEQTLNTELAGAKFIAHQVRPTVSYSYRFYPYVRFFDPNNLLVRCITFAPQYERSNPISLELMSTAYISDSLQSHNYMVYAFEHDPIRNWIEENNGRIKMIYDNGSFWTYMNGLVGK
ncbi:MAG: hypothetical protein VR68_12065 [Peptococcaceae bacterium BRH_c4a]|nr:MAG: hypothetical protein VR68_12065 [Peptococcaceae bacterium BRH_c4a]